MKKALWILMFLCAAAWTGQARADYLYEWAAGDMIADADDFGKDAKDILGAWHAYENGSHYFRIDIQSAPRAGDFAGLYGIYIDAGDGGADGADLQYVPGDLNGIDFILDSHYDPNMGGWIVNDYHYGWNGTNFMRSAPDAAQQSENGGKTLEWMIAGRDIGTTFTWWAATHDMGSETETYAYDITAPVSAVPVPATIVLLGTGLACISGCRRFRKVR